MYINHIKEQKLEAFINRYMNDAVRTYIKASKRIVKGNVADLEKINKMVAEKCVLKDVFHYTDANSRTCVLVGNLTQNNSKILRATFTPFSCSCEDCNGDVVSYDAEWMEMVYNELKLISEDFAQEYCKECNVRLALSR